VAIILQIMPLVFSFDVLYEYAIGVPGCTHARSGLIGVGLQLPFFQNVLGSIIELCEYGN
jgi:hypothetical protein